MKFNRKTISNKKRNHRRENTEFAHFKSS